MSAGRPNTVGETPVLEVDNLTKHFPVSRKLFGRDQRLVRAVDGVSWHIPQASSLGLVGESGCGKTTVGRTILNLLPSSGGQVLFEGQDVSGLSHREWRPLWRDHRRR